LCRLPGYRPPDLLRTRSCLPAAWAELAFSLVIGMLVTKGVPVQGEEPAEQAAKAEADRREADRKLDA
jgi:hypothetical protein